MIRFFTFQINLLQKTDCQVVITCLFPEKEKFQFIVYISVIMKDEADRFYKIIQTVSETKQYFEEA